MIKLIEKYLLVINVFLYLLLICKNIKELYKFYKLNQ